MGETGSEKKAGRLFVVSGPSGSGKSTLCREAIRRSDVVLSVSATTRPRSETEIDGKDYFFLTEEEFQQKIRAGEFLEYARVFEHYYGTPAGPVMEQLDMGRTVVLEIDVQGAAQVFFSYPKAVGILVLPPTPEELERRLRGRGRDAEAIIARRLAKAQWEIEQTRQQKNYQYTIINDDLESAIAEMVELFKNA